MNNISLEEEFREWNLKTPTKQGSTIPKERNSTMEEKVKIREKKFRAYLKDTTSQKGNKFENLFFAF